MDINEIFLDVVDSTQTYAKKNVKSFEKNKITTITANEQTLGRGRFQREWISPKDVNLYTTFYFTLPKNQLHFSSISHLLALSFIQVLLENGLHPKIKWPNDVLLNNKKVSGILCETSIVEDLLDIFLGIGINVNMDDDFINIIDQPATSLKKETNKIWDKKELLGKIEKQFSIDLEEFKKTGFNNFHAKFENLLAYKNEKICLFDGEQTYCGILHSTTCDGQINIYLENKEIKTFSAGDVSLKK